MTLAVSERNHPVSISLAPTDPSSVAVPWIGYLDAAPSRHVPGSVALTKRVMLEPGADGELPVTVRWKRMFSGPETIAVDGDVAYIADEELVAVRISDGAVLWRAGGSEWRGLGADGGVVIGLDGPDRVRAWAPFNYDITVDRRTGERLRLRWTPGGRLPRTLTPFPRPPHRRYTFRSFNPAHIVARDRAGRVAFRITNPQPWFDNGPAIEIPGGILMMVSNGQVVALDYR